MRIPVKLELHCFSYGGFQKSREILKSFENENMIIDLFVMVTATFAKPNIAYEGFLDNQSPVVLQWGYEDQQLMKEIDTNSVNLELLKQNRLQSIEVQLLLVLESENTFSIF